MKFKVGDQVKPAPGWEWDGEIKTGRVKAVAPYGLGQSVLVEGAKKWKASGMFEKVEE